MVHKISVLAGLTLLVWWSLWVSEIAVDNFGAFLGGDAVSVVFHQASGTLASRHTGFEAVSLDHAERHVFVKTRLRTRRPAFIKHIAAVQRTAHSYRNGGKKRWS